MLARVGGDDTWDDILDVPGGIGSAHLELLRHRAPAQMSRSPNSTSSRPGTIAMAPRGNQSQDATSGSPGIFGSIAIAPWGDPSHDAVLGAPGILGTIPTAPRRNQLQDGMPGSPGTVGTIATAPHWNQSHDILPGAPGIYGTIAVAPRRNQPHNAMPGLPGALGTIAIAPVRNQSHDAMSGAPGSLDGLLAAPRLPHPLARWPEDHCRPRAPSPPRSWQPLDVQAVVRHGPSSLASSKGSGTRGEWAAARALVCRMTSSLSRCLGVMALQFAFVAWRGFCQEAGGANELESSQFFTQDMMYAWSRRAARALVLAERRRPAQLRSIMLVWKGLVSNSKLAVLNKRLGQLQKQTQHLVAKESAPPQSVAALMLQLWRGFAEASSRVRHLISRESCVRMHALDVLVTRKDRALVLRALFALRLHSAELRAERHLESQTRVDIGIESAEALEIAELRQVVRQMEDQLLVSRSAEAQAVQRALVQETALESAELWAARHLESQARVGTGIESAAALEIAELRQVLRQTEDQLLMSKNAEAEAVQRALAQEAALEESRAIVDESRGIVFAQQRERQDLEDEVSRLSDELRHFHAAHEASARALGDVQALLSEAERAGGCLLDSRSSRSSEPLSGAVVTELERLRGAQLQVDALRQELHALHQVPDLEGWQHVRIPLLEPVAEEEDNVSGVGLPEPRLRREWMMSSFATWCRWACASRRDRTIEQMQISVGRIGLHSLLNVEKVVARHALFRDLAQVRLVMVAWREMLLVMRNTSMGSHVAEQTQYVQQLQQHGAVSSFGALCTVGRCAGQLELPVMRSAFLSWRSDVVTLQKCWLREQLVISGGLLQQSELQARSWGARAFRAVDVLAVRALTRQFVHAWRVETLSALEERLRGTAVQFHACALRTLRMVVASVNSTLVRAALRAWAGMLSTRNRGSVVRSRRCQEEYLLQPMSSLLDRFQRQSLRGVLAYWWGMVSANFSERLREQLIHSNSARQKHVSGILLDLALCCSAALLRVVTVAWQHDVKQAHVRRSVAYLRDRKHQSVSSIVLHAVMAYQSVVAHAILAAWQNTARACWGPVVLQQEVQRAQADIRGLIFSEGSVLDRQQRMRLLRTVLGCWREIVLGIWNERIGERLAEQNLFLEQLQHQSLVSGKRSERMQEQLWQSRCDGRARLAAAISGALGARGLQQARVALAIWHVEARLSRSHPAASSEHGRWRGRVRQAMSRLAFGHVGVLVRSSFAAWRVSVARLRPPNVAPQQHGNSSSSSSARPVPVSRRHCGRERLLEELQEPDPEQVNSAIGRSDRSPSTAPVTGSSPCDRGFDESHHDLSCRHVLDGLLEEECRVLRQKLHERQLLDSALEVADVEERGKDAWMEAMRRLISDLQQENEELISALVEQPRRLAATLQDAAGSRGDLEVVRDRFLGVTP